MKTEDLIGVTLQTLSPQEVKDKMDNNEIVLIDVRTPFEYGFEHILGALLFPLASFDPKKLPSQEGKPIVFHCGSGMRSHKIAELCAQAGISPLAHMDGGLGGWKQAKLPHMAIDPNTGAHVLK
ncbi:MAG: rhodanese-like domain-containing protein [Amylibacter sp.]|nr:rhodanese-like domain-containing protein [Amylibacter sp.]